MSTRDRKGVTAIDVVVVIVILMVLAAVFLPRVEYSHRTASRRSDCKNKLKQIGIALHTYHEAHQTFPPGWVRVRGPKSGEEEQSAYAWSFYILPQLDQAPLFKKFNFSDSDPSFQTQADAMPNKSQTGLGAVYLPGYRCPSDIGEEQSLAVSGMLMGTTNYVGNFGVGVPERGHDSSLMQGLFGENSRVRIRDIRDGTTNFVMAGERRLSRIGRDWPADSLDGPFNSHWAGLPRSTNPLAIVATVTTGIHERVDSEAAAARRADIKNDLLNLQGPLNGVQGNSPRLLRFLPNRTSTGQAMSGLNAEIVNAGFSSQHPGGLNILLGDGSVRFISDSVDPATYINMMRRADGEVLGVF